MYLYTNWSWNEQPKFVSTDIIAFTWGRDFSYNSRTANGNILYTLTKNGIDFDTDQKITKSGGEPGKGVYFKIPMTKWSNKFGKSYWAKAVSAVTEIEIDRSIKSVDAQAGYGHGVWDVSPGVSFPWGGCISFNGNTLEDDVCDKIEIRE